jgi:hypothetical protein
MAGHANQPPQQNKEFLFRALLIARRAKEISCPASAVLVRIIKGKVWPWNTLESAPVTLWGLTMLAGSRGHPVSIVGHSDLGSTKHNPARNSGPYSKCHELLDDPI